MKIPVKSRSFFIHFNATGYFAIFDNARTQKMNFLSEQDFIGKCRSLIETRLESVTGRDWKNRDFEYLSGLIYEKTRISVSISTLKRIWQDKNQRIPHVSTLNALAGFLDYDSWYDFKEKIKSEISPGASGGERTRNGKRRRNLVVINLSIIGILVVVSFLLLNLRKDKTKGLSFNPGDIVFTYRKTASAGLPNSTVFYYDISRADFDSAFIQQDWDKSKRARISKEDHYLTSIYYYPNFYDAKLILNDSVVRTVPVNITTEKWVAVYSKEFMGNNPIYLKNIDVVKDDRLFVSIDDLELNAIENDKDFFMSFFNVRDFGEVYCDNFMLESEIRNDPKEGGLTCQLAGISVTGEKGFMIATFSDPGCTSMLELSFADYYLNGSTSDLSAFGTDLTQWRHIKYEVIDKTVTIFIERKEVFSFTYGKDIGKLVGIGYHFYGCGSAKSSRLYDGNGQLIYDGGFEEDNV